MLSERRRSQASSCPLAISFGASRCPRLDRGEGVKNPHAKTEKEAPEKIALKRTCCLSAGEAKRVHAL